MRPMDRQNPHHHPRTTRPQMHRPNTQPPTMPRMHPTPTPRRSRRRHTSLTRRITPLPRQLRTHAPPMQPMEKQPNTRRSTTTTHNPKHTTHNRNTTTNHNTHQLVTKTTNPKPNNKTHNTTTNNHHPHPLPTPHTGPPLGIGPFSPQYFFHTSGR